MIIRASCNIGARQRKTYVPRLLPLGFKHIKSYSYGQANTGNLIINGENLFVLNSIAPHYKGRIRCVYIDPPYNNQENYAHYSDDLSHDLWLNNITARIELLSKLLADNGSLWISIDDREVHYLKVAVDHIFGRKNFITTVIWQQRTTRENRKVFSNDHEYLLVYAKDARCFADSRNLLPLPSEIRCRYKNPDNDPRGPWQSVSLNVQAGHGTASQFYELIAPNGSRHSTPKGRCWIYSHSRMQEEITRNNVWFGRDGNGVPRKKRFLSESSNGLTPHTLWPADEVGTNDIAKKDLLKLFPKHRLFDTPKPEQLVRRVLQIATDPGDFVLDAYLGSGTTTAVAHKMGRRYIGIEQGKHAITHCVYRMKQVIDGEEAGISDVEAWKGGGGFDFFQQYKNGKKECGSGGQVRF
jgi:adenine-specific DNA-methyltransferase